MVMAGSAHIHLIHGMNHVQRCIYVCWPDLRLYFIVALCIYMYVYICEGMWLSSHVSLGVATVSIAWNRLTLATNKPTSLSPFVLLRLYI